MWQPCTWLPGEPARRSFVVCAWALRRARLQAAWDAHVYGANLANCLHAPYSQNQAGDFSAYVLHCLLPRIFDATHM